MLQAADSTQPLALDQFATRYQPDATKGASQIPELDSPQTPESIKENLLGQNSSHHGKQDINSDDEDDTKLYQLAAALVSIANSPVVFSSTTSYGQPEASDSNVYVRAYAKIEGTNASGTHWVHFMKKPTCIFGRAPAPELAYTAASSRKPSDGGNSTEEPTSDLVDFYLGDDAVLSEKHLLIRYSPDNAAWELVCMGRSGCIVDGVALGPFGTPAILKPVSVVFIPEHIDSDDRTGAAVSFRFVLPGPEELSASRSTTPTSSEGDKRHRHHRRQLSGSSSSSSGSSTWKSYDPTKPNGPGRRRRFKENDDAANSPPSPHAVAHVGDELTKPSQSYACLIAEAINSVPERRMTLSGIYQYLSENYPYFRQTKNGWQNSVRHNLSLNKAFKKIPRDIGEQGKGMFWVVDADFEHLVRGSSGRRTASRSRPATPLPEPLANEHLAGDLRSPFFATVSRPLTGPPVMMNSLPLQANAVPAMGSHSNTPMSTLHPQILPKPVQRFPEIQPYPLPQLALRAVSELMDNPANTLPSEIQLAEGSSVLPDHLGNDQP